MSNRVNRELKPLLKMAEAVGGTILFGLNSVSFTTEQLAELMQLSENENTKLKNEIGLLQQQLNGLEHLRRTDNA